MRVKVVGGSVCVYSEREREILSVCVRTDRESY